MGHWKICRIPLVLGVSVVPSRLQPALPSAPLLSLLSIAVTIVLLPPWLETPLLNVLGFFWFFVFFFFFLAQGGLAPCLQEQPENRDPAYYRHYPFSRAGNCLLGSLNISGTPAPATLQPPCTLYPMIPFPTLLFSRVRFGGLAAVCKDCKSLATLLSQTTSFSRKHFLLSETEMGNKGVFRGLWCICCFLQLRVLCKCSLQHSSRI